MDIRFLAIIFLVAALMEMLSKMMRKARQREIEGEAAPRSADPLAQAFKEMELLSDVEEALEPARQELERGRRERSALGTEAEPGAEDVAPGAEDAGGEPAEPWALPVSPSRASPAGRPDLPPVPSRRVAKPMDSRPRVERLFEPAEPVVPPTAPEPPVPAAPELHTVPARDRAPRPVEVRSREFRPRDGREVVRPSAEADTAPVAAGAVPEERSPGRVEKGRIAADVAETGVLGLGSVRGLRRLVVAREVLGPPLALRGEEPSELN